MNELQRYLKNKGGLYPIRAKEVVDDIVKSKYNYDCDDILTKLKTAVKKRIYQTVKLILFMRNKTLY
jgi:hypothetical protein